MLASLLLTPGGILGSLAVKSRTFDPFGLGSPVATLALNSLIYSAIAYPILRRIKSNLSGRRLWMAVAAATILALSACVPAVSPLWPRGMSQLAEKERLLRNGLPLGSDLSSAQSFLRRQGIDSSEFKAEEDEVVLQSAHLKIVAERGDHVLSTIVPTDAGQFPCGYRIDVLLVFNADEKLKQSRIERFPLCP